MPTSEIRELPEERCWELLADHDVGRLAVSVMNRPDIFPVNYVVADGAIMVRSAPGQKFAAATLGTAVAFEVDALDETTKTGWSIVVQGPGRVDRESGRMDRGTRSRHRQLGAGLEGAVPADRARDRHRPHHLPSGSGAALVLDQLIGLDLLDDSEPLEQHLIPSLGRHRLAVDRSITVGLELVAGQHDTGAPVVEQPGRERRCAPVQRPVGPEGAPRPARSRRAGGPPA